MPSQTVIKKELTEQIKSTIYPPLPSVNTKPFHFPRETVVRATNHFWIDTRFKDIPEKIGYDLYPQLARGHGQLGSYLYRLPPGYEAAEDSANAEDRYPVLYWLHGGNETQHSACWALEFYGRKMEEGLMPKAIIIAPQALTKGRYIDNLDGARPIATIISRDLVGIVDARYRTIPHPTARWIEGFSMGGFGTLHLGFKYPDIFGAVSMLAGALLVHLHEEPEAIVGDTFFGNQAFYDSTHPYALVAKNIAAIRDGPHGQTPIRLVGGSEDTRLNRSIERVAARFEELGLAYAYEEVQGVGHDYEWLLAGLGEYAWTYWQGVDERVVRSRA